MLLTPVQTRALFLDARQNRYAVLAVNADSPAAIVDCLDAARLAGTPVLIETSLWQLTGHSFGHGDPILGLRQYHALVQNLAESARFADVPVALHTDHIKGPRTVEIVTAAMAIGFSSVSLDSSALTERENLATACALCRFAAEHGLPITLEMEAGVDDGLTVLEVTDRLVGGIEASFPGALALWAPGCGTRHGFADGGFPAFSAEHVASQQARASRVAGRPIGIALHGSSGLADHALHAAVAAGVVKVNWSSESLLLRTQSARRYYQENGHLLEAGAAGFKDAAMDHGVQAFVAAHYVPVVAARMRRLRSEKGPRTLPDLTT